MSEILDYINLELKKLSPEDGKKLLSLFISGKISIENDNINTITVSDKDEIIELIEKVNNTTYYQNKQKLGILRKKINDSNEIDRNENK